MTTLDELPEGSKEFFRLTLTVLPNGSIALASKYDGKVLEAEPATDEETALNCHFTAAMIHKTVQAVMGLAESANSMIDELNEERPNDNEVSSSGPDRSTAGQLKRHGGIIH